MTHIKRTVAPRFTFSTYLATTIGLGMIACSVQTEDGMPEPSASVGPGDQAATISEENRSGEAASTGGAEPGHATGTGGGGEPVGTIFSDPGCERGLKNNAETTCCPATCGFCGGEGCEDNPGGAEACCSGAIASRGVSCTESEAPCSLDDEDSSNGSGGDTGTGGNMGSGGSDPNVCNLETPVAGLPSYEFTMHNVLTKRMERKDFCDAAKWYDEWLGADGRPVQQFSLQQGDDMADYVTGGRSHQRCEFEDGLWATKGSDDWIEWEGRMVINKHPENTITLGQMFGPNGPDARIEIRTNGSLGVGSLNGGSGNVTLSADDNVGNSFKIKMRTNGDRVEVYFNDSLAVDRPTDGNNGQKWHFRWGVYSNDIPQEASPLTNTVSELVVSG